MASTRLPGKPLADINGKPMIVRVLEKCREADIGPVIVATPDGEIADVVRGVGFDAVLTQRCLVSGSDAVWDAIKMRPEQDTNRVAVNVQGDQVGILPEHIKSVLLPIADFRVDMATLVAPLSDAERNNENTVKAVVGKDGRALYFSRLPIPSGPGTLWGHIGVYAYRRQAIQRFANLPPSPLELRERLEQLRALENRMVIGCAVVDSAPLEVNTQADLDRVRGLLN